MKKLGGIIVILIVASIAAYGLTHISKEVQAGRIVSCSHCNKEVESNLETVSVPLWDFNTGRVEQKTILCSPCGDERIPYKNTSSCGYCGKHLSTWTEHAKRRTKSTDKYYTNDFCSSSCRKKKNAYDTVDDVSEKVGDGIGRVSRGLSDGFMKHMR